MTLEKSYGQLADPRPFYKMQMQDHHLKGSKQEVVSI